MKIAPVRTGYEREVVLDITKFDGMARKLMGGAELWVSDWQPQVKFEDGWAAVGQLVANSASG